MHGLLRKVRMVYHEAHEERGVTQQDIAERLNVDAAVVSRWINGRQNMTVRTLHNIARAMDCRLTVELEDTTQLHPSNAAGHGESNFVFLLTPDDSDPASMMKRVMSQMSTAGSQNGQTNL